MEFTNLAIRLTAFGFWTVEPGFDILRINRGPEIAIEALNSMGGLCPTVMGTHYPGPEMEFTNLAIR
jgi:hypothetical protein